MYVCICNAVTEQDIHDIVAEGSGSMRELRERLGVCDCCGRCASCARDVLNHALRATPRLQAAASSRECTAA
jgi:bacterioferritin-associated ferredoxin